MSKSVLEGQVRDLFSDLRKQAASIIENSKTRDNASERIVASVSSKVSAEGEGYLIDIYAKLVEKVKSDEFFKDPDHLNSFYRLNLREEISEKYSFDIKSLSAYREGIKCDEANSIFINLAKSAGAAAGVTGLATVLKYAFIHSLSVPIIVIFAGAVGVGVFYALEQSRRKKDFLRAVEKYLSDMENQILDWLCEIEMYFEEQVRSLYKL